MPVISPPTITGSTRLPADFPHVHASEQAREIAERGMILRVQVGSGVHGTSIAGQDDRDEMGLCLEPTQFVTGLARVPNGTRGESASVRFEQYERHTAWDRAGGLANRSGAGDLDVIIYSARKWARLALAGNPTVLLVLFVPDDEVVFRDEVGAELTANAHRFVSRQAADRYLGYLQGIELLSTGRVTLPVPEPGRSYLRSIRRGERPLAEVMDAITEAQARLTQLKATSDVPAEPDRGWVDAWLHRSYLEFWSRPR